MLCRSWSLSAYCASKASCHLKLPLLTPSHASVLVISMEKGLFLSMRINRLGGTALHTFPELTEGSGQCKPPNKLVQSAGCISSSLPRRQNCSVHIWDLLHAGSGWAQAKARVECHCSLAQVYKAWWSLKECTSCPCIQRLSLASSHVLWTPRRVWHNRGVLQGWHPHATSSSDCSPTAVLQTFPAPD